MIPLHLRAPNPPAPFVGRESDLAWLRARRVAVLTGPAGWGKSALVAAHVAGAEPVLRLEGHDDPRLSLAARVLRALAAALGIATVDLGRGDGDDLVARTIDLADGAGATIWIDAVSPAAGEPAARLLSLAARYARRARFYATSQAPLPEVPAELQHTPAALDLAALGALLRAVEPAIHGPRAQRLARLAEGSPGALLALRLGAEPLVPSPAAARGLTLLRASRVGVPLEALSEVVGAAAVDELLAHHAVRSGPLVRATPGEARAPAPADLSALVAALHRHGSSEARLEAARLALDAGEVPVAAAILSASLDALLAEGYAPELWELLEARAREPRLAAARLRVAAEHGGPALEKLAPPAESATIAEAFAWLKAHYAREDHRTVRRHGATIAERADAEGAAELSWELWLMAASSAMGEGALDEAAALLGRAPAPHERAALSIRAVHALLAARRGDRDEAAAMAESLLGRLGALVGRDRAQLTYNVGLVLYGLGRPDQAAELFERTFPIDDLSTAALLSRRALELDAHLSVLGGRLERGRALLDRLAKFVVPGTPTEGRRALIEATLALATGELGAAAGGIARGAALARTYAGQEDLAYARMLAAQLAWRSDAPPGPADPATTPSARLAAGWHALAAAAFEGHAPAPVGGTPELDALVLGHALLVRALAGGALTDAELAALEHAAERAPSVPARLALDLVAVELALLRGRATTARGPEPERALLAAISAADVPALVALAVRDDLSGRIASGLLGGEGPRGVLGQRLFTAARAVLGWPSARRSDRGLADAARADRVLVDGPRGRLVDGDVVTELSQQPVLLRLLAALAVHGEADKETLVRAVWGGEIREYHPLKHDNRLRLAVKKLRARLGPGPELLATRPGGYALARPLVWLGPLPG